MRAATCAHEEEALAALLALVVATAPFAPPLLDAGEDFGPTHVESHHDPSSCARLHDHAACSQLARTFAILPFDVPGALRVPERSERIPIRATPSRGFRGHLSPYPPRAPPLDS